MKHWNAAFLERLLQVQSTDLKIRQLDHQIQIYYQRSKEEDGELTRLKMEISRVDENIEAVESQNQMYSTTLEDIRTAIKGLLTTKSGVPKPRTRSSTEALKIEEEKLGALVDETTTQLGDYRTERDLLVERAEARAKTLEKDQEGPEAEIRKLQQQIKKLEKQREEEVKGLPSMLLKHYDRLRSSRSGIGLTVLRDGVCTVCRMQMPTAVVSRMTKGERIPVCPACGRMVARIEIVDLIPEEETEAPAAASESVSAKKKKVAKAKAAASKPVKKIGKKVATQKQRKQDASEAESKPVEKSPSSETPSAKKTPAKAAAKKSSAKKAVSKKAPVKKAAATGQTAKKGEPPAPKKPEKKTAAKKTAAKKVAATKVDTKKKPAAKSAKKSDSKTRPAAKKKG